MDCCVNTVDDLSMSSENFVNFSPVTSEILWLIYREWVGAHRQKCALHWFLKIVR